MASNFESIDDLILARFGRPLFSFSLREALSMYHGLLLENKNQEERDELEALLNGEDRASSAKSAVDNIQAGLLAGGDINELFAEFG